MLIIQLCAVAAFIITGCLVAWRCEWSADTSPDDLVFCWVEAYVITLIAGTVIYACCYC